MQLLFNCMVHLYWAAGTKTHDIPLFYVIISSTSVVILHTSASSVLFYWGTTPKKAVPLPLFPDSFDKNGTVTSSDVSYYDSLASLVELGSGQPSLTSHIWSLASQEKNLQESTHVITATPKGFASINSQASDFCHSNNMKLRDQQSFLHFTDLRQHSEWIIVAEPAGHTNMTF